MNYRFRAAKFWRSWSRLSDVQRRATGWIAEINPLKSLGQWQRDSKLATGGKFCNDGFWDYNSPKQFWKEVKVPSLV